MYQRHLARKLKLRRFSMEIDQKNGAILMSMVLEQFGKLINFEKKHFFLKSIFSKKIPSNAFHLS